MKHDARIAVITFALLWALAWSAAGRGAAAERGGAADTPADAPDTTATATPAAARDAAVTLRVLRGGNIETMPMDAYLRGVLRAEMPASFEPEALKAQAIAARTYTYYKMNGAPIAAHPDADACDDINCCKAYKTAADAAADWGSMALYYEEKLARAVAETDGEVLLYDGAPILAVFFSSTGGYTQNAGAVWQSDLPYLQSVSSPETEALVPNYYSVARIPANELRARFLAVHPEAKLSGAPSGWISSLTRNDAGFVASVAVGGVTVKGNELRGILGLRSPSFTVETDGGDFVFHVTGYGHGVGMSQYGANALAREGMPAEQIVEHYFRGAQVGTP